MSHDKLEDPFFVPLTECSVDIFTDGLYKWWRFSRGESCNT